ncbi:helix-turn-helix transcriptional regulator [Streptomyces californicus]|uniref:helix-turn-helix transcriptional regulator n=1 Tax=Streptomyces californicus TaxID=67351 RepID=UPI0037F15AD3
MEDEELQEAGRSAESSFINMMRWRRAGLGISQTELAERVVQLGGKMYQQTIAKIESGQRAVRLDEAEYIAQALETTVAKMLSSAIDREEPKPDRTSIFDLLPQKKQVEHLLMGAESILDRSLEEAELAEVQVHDAQYRAMKARTEVQRNKERRDELRRQYEELNKLSMSKQNEFNRRLGPRWMQMLEEDPELEWDTSPEPESSRPFEEPREGK